MRCDPEQSRCRRRCRSDDLHARRSQALGQGARYRNAPEAEHPEARLRTVPLGGVPGKISLRYGLGILNINGFLGHNGAILGYGTAMFYLPSAHATFVVEVNNNNLSSTVPTDIFVQLADALFPRQFPNGT
jgi:CubicO group peptidase (beta-lactamase class C family)